MYYWPLTCSSLKDRNHYNTKYFAFNTQLDHEWQSHLQFINYYAIRQKTLKQTCFIKFENPLVALVATSYILIVSDFLCSIYLLLWFCAFFYLKYFGHTLQSNCWYLIEEFWNYYLSMPINNQLWHRRVGHFSSWLNKQKKQYFLHIFVTTFQKR